VPVFVGFKFPYKVISTSEALGVWRRFIVKEEVTAVAGDIKTDSEREKTKANIFNFIAQ